MRRTDPYDLIPYEREELDRMLNTLIQVKECIRSFEDGEISLRDVVCQMAEAISTGLATPLSGKPFD